MAQIKLIGFCILFAAIVGAYFRYDYVVKDRDSARAELSKTKGIIEKERQSAQEAANRSLAFRIDEANREIELNKLRDCVAAGTCGIRVRYQTCPALPDTAASGSDAAGAVAQSQRQFEQWYFSHRELIDKYEARVKALQYEVRARAAPDYCQPKNS